MKTTPVTVTPLDYDSEFRSAFLRLILDDPADGGTQEWTAAVKEDRVDATLESPGTFVLIEDRIGSGAKQREQLLRYYRGSSGSSIRRRVAQYDKLSYRMVPVPSSRGSDGQAVQIDSPRCPVRP